VFLAGVKVGIVAHLHGQQQFHRRAQQQHFVGVRGQLPVASGKQFGKAAADGGPGRLAQGHEVVQVAARKDGRVRHHPLQKPFLRQPGQVEHVVPDGYARPRAAVRGAKNAVREVMNGKITLVRHPDPALEGIAFHKKNV
jgi:hypothetical protein